MGVGVALPETCKNLAEIEVAFGIRDQFDAEHRRKMKFRLRRRAAVAKAKARCSTRGLLLAQREANFPEVLVRPVPLEHPAINKGSSGQALHGFHPGYADFSTPRTEQELVLMTTLC